MAYTALSRISPRQGRFLSKTFSTNFFVQASTFRDYLASKQMKQVNRERGSGICFISLDRIAELSIKEGSLLFAGFEMGLVLFAEELWAFEEPAVGRFIRCAALIFFSCEYCTAASADERTESCRIF